MLENVTVQILQKMPLKEDTARSLAQRALPLSPSPAGLARLQHIQRLDELKPLVRLQHARLGRAFAPGRRELGQRFDHGRDLRIKIQLLFFKLFYKRTSNITY